MQASFFCSRFLFCMDESVAADGRGRAALGAGGGLVSIHISTAASSMRRCVP